MNGICWYYDAAALVFLVLFIIHGAKKGLSKTIIGLALNIVVMLLAFFLSAMMTDMFYDNYIKDSTVYNVEETVSGFDTVTEMKKLYTELTLIENVPDQKIENVLSSVSDMDGSMKELIDATSGACENISTEDCYVKMKELITVELQDKLSKTMPSCAGKYFENFDESGKEETFKIINLIYKDSKEASAYIMSNYVENQIYVLSQIIVFIISSVIMMIITSIILSIAFREKDMTSNGRGDSVAGGITAVLSWGAVMLISALLIKVIIYYGIQISGFLDDESLNNTIAFRFFYNADRLFLRK